MKTAISIPDDLFEVAERMRRERRVTRSALYAEAIRSYVDWHRNGVRTPGSWAGRFEMHETEDEAVGSDPEIAAMFAESADAEAS